MHKERSEENQRGVIQNINRKVQVFVSAYGFVEVEDEGRQTERGEVQHKGRTSTLLEKYEEAYEEIDEPDEIEIKIARLPIRDRRYIVDVGVIKARLFRERRALYEIDQMTADACLFEVNENLPVLVNRVKVALVFADGEETVAGKNARARACGIRSNGFGDDAVFGLSPLDAVCGRRFVLPALQEIERPGSHQ